MSCASQCVHVTCRREWPIQGGECHQGATGDNPSIVITGHEDGKVKLWRSQRNALSLMTCLDTARYFTTDDFRNLVTRKRSDRISSSSSQYFKINTEYFYRLVTIFSSSDNDSEMGSDDWPPFRKVGNFDPFTDDPR